MKQLPLPVLILFLACSAGAEDDRCKGICGRRPLASSHSSNLRIIGGVDVLPGTWPWIVSIQIPSQAGYKHSCGGSLISSRWVITAAHCFLNKRFLDNWKLVLGAAQLSRPGPDAQERTIKNLVEHQEYRRTSHFNDVALMELSQPVNCSDYIQPACLPDKAVEVSSLKHCYVSGWGVTDLSKPTETSDILQEAKVKLISLKKCNSTAWYNKKIHYNNICAGHEQGEIDSCQGDSGGPLMCREQRSERFWVVGVTSWGSGCAQAKRPGIYSSTQLFLDWIQDVTKEDFSPSSHSPKKKQPTTPTVTVKAGKRFENWVQAWQKPTQLWDTPASENEIHKFDHWVQALNTRPTTQLTLPWPVNLQPEPPPPPVQTLSPWGTQSGYYWNPYNWPTAYRPPPRTRFLPGAWPGQGGQPWSTMAKTHLPKLRPQSHYSGWQQYPNWKGGVTKPPFPTSAFALWNAQKWSRPASYPWPSRRTRPAE